MDKFDDIATLLYDNKDNMSEGVYLELNNSIKDLYEYVNNIKSNSNNTEVLEYYKYEVGRLNNKVDRFKTKLNKSKQEVKQLQNKLNKSKQEVKQLQNKLDKFKTKPDKTQMHKCNKCGLYIQISYSMDKHQATKRCQDKHRYLSGL